MDSRGFTGETFAQNLVIFLSRMCFETKEFGHRERRTWLELWGSHCPKNPHLLWVFFVKGTATAFLSLKPPRLLSLEFVRYVEFLGCSFKSHDFLKDLLRVSSRDPWDCTEIVLDSLCHPPRIVVLFHQRLIVEPVGVTNTGQQTSDLVTSSNLHLLLRDALLNLQCREAFMTFMLLSRMF